MKFKQQNAFHISNKRINIEVKNGFMAANQKKALSGLLSKFLYYEEFEDRKNSKIIIRTAKAGDMKQIREVAYDSWRDLPNNKDKTHFSVTLRYLNNKIRKHNNFIILVAEKSKQIIGFVWGYTPDMDKFPVKGNKALEDYISTHSKTSYIDELAVEHKFRMRGIARALLNGYKAMGKQNGINELILSTKNPVALRLYKKKHYKQMYDSNGKRITDVEKDGIQTFIYTFLHLKINAK